MIVYASWKRLFAKFKSILRPSLILGGSLFIVLLLFISRSPKSPESRPEKSWPIAAQTLQQKEYQPNTIVYGRVEPLYSTTLRAGVAGYILSIDAQEGLTFKQGATLAQIDPIDAELAVKERAQAVAKLSAQLQAEQNKHAFDKIMLQKQEALIGISSRSVERQNQLAKRNLSAQANIETEEINLFKEQISLQDRKLIIENYPERIKQLQAELQSAQAQLEQFKLDLERTRIIAPFDGRVSQRFVSIGDRVQINQEILKLYDINTLEIKTQFPSREISLLQNYLKNKQVIRASVVGHNQDLNIRLNRIAGEINTNQAGIEAIFRIDKKDPPLRVGQVLELLVYYPIIKGLYALPFTSLYESGSNDLVYKIETINNEHRLKRVLVERKGDHYIDSKKRKVLIKSNELSDGDLVLTTHLPNAHEGLRVDIREVP